MGFGRIARTASTQRDFATSRVLTDAASLGLVPETH